MLIKYRRSVLFLSFVISVISYYIHIKLFITQNPLSIKDIQIKIAIYNTLHTVR